MTENGKTSKAKEHTIKLTISMEGDDPSVSLDTTDSTSKVEETKSIFQDEMEMLSLANLSKKTGERNTEHGKTLVQIIDFREESQRKKIIRMLVDHYSGILWKLLPFLRNLGGHPRAEIRKRVAETVGELMCEDFIKVKDEVLIHWAMHGSPIVNTNVGLALAIVAEDERYKGNVKSLLNHWVTISNPDLNWTALASCVPLSSFWPDDILGYIEKSLNRGRIESLALSIFVIRELCRTGNASTALSHLSNWIRRDKNEINIRAGSVVIFLEAIDFSDVIGKQELINFIVEIYLVGLEDRSLDNAGEYRSLVLEKLRIWMQSTVDDKRKLDEAENLFMQLYQQSSKRGRERLEFIVPRWLNTPEGTKAKIYHRLVKNLNL